jgi:DNA-binding IclR family transcriptional regulator
MSARAEKPTAGAMVLTVERGMQVLRAFRSDRAPLSNAELARRTGMSKAAVSRLTSTLIQLGYIRHVPGGREFELAAGPLGVGHAFISSSGLLRTAHPFLQELADRLGVSVALAIGNGNDMLYIAYRASHKVATLRLGTGSVLPMGTTSIGHAYLWALPVGEQKRMMAALQKGAGSAGAGVVRGIRESFAELERSGVCGVLGGFQRDAYGVALPVRVGREKIVMGLSCGKADLKPDLAAERKRIAPVLRDAACRLETLLADFDGEP